MTTTCAFARELATNSVVIETMNFISVGLLFLNPNGGGARREDDAILLAFRQWDFEQTNIGGVIGFWSEALLLDERLKLLLCRITSSFFITLCIGPLRGGVARA